MEEKNNNNNNEEDVVKKAGKAAGEAIKNQVSQKVKSKLIQLLPKILPIIGGFLLAWLAFSVIYLVINLVISFFTSLLSSIFSPTQNANSNTSEINQTSSIVYIDKDSGAYKIQDDFSKKILEELENQNIDTEAAGFVTEDLEDMLDKYIKAEVQTMFPKTSVWGNDVDGLITVQRASTDGTTKTLTYKKYKDFIASPTLDTFSINPDNFKLCILEKGNYTDYYDFGGTTKISGMSTSTGENVREMDYQTIMQNYALPFNFSIVLHMMAQDVDFMKEFLEMAIKENEANPIILTYVESSSTTTEWKEYIRI